MTTGMPTATSGQRGQPPPQPTIRNFFKPAASASTVSSPGNVAAPSPSGGSVVPPVTSTTIANVHAAYVVGSVVFYLLYIVVHRFMLSEFLALLALLALSSFCTLALHAHSSSSLTTAGLYDHAVRARIDALCEAYPPACAVVVELMRALDGHDGKNDDSATAKRQRVEEGGAATSTVSTVSSAASSAASTAASLAASTAASLAATVSATTVSSTATSSSTPKTLATAPASTVQPLATIPDLSFQMPRKKLNLVFGATALCLVALLKEGSSTGVAPAPLSTIAYTSIRHCLCLPTPAKAKPHWTYVLVVGDRPPATFDDDGAASVIAFTVADWTPSVTVNIASEAIANEAAARGAKGLPAIATDSGASNRQRIDALLSHFLPSTVRLVEPSADEFRSALPPPYSSTYAASTSSSSSSSRGRATGKPPPLLYATAYWKAKEVHLYLLRTGLFIGFRKPLLFLPVQAVRGLDISSITSRTFDVTVRYEVVGGAEVELALSMVACEEFDGIMAYTAKHRLNEPTIVGQSLEGATRGDFSAYADGVAKEDDDDTKDAQNDMVVDDMKPEAAEEPLVDRKGKGKASVSNVPAAPLIDAAEDDSDDEDEDETYRPPASDDDDSEVGEEFDSEYESGSEAGGGSEADSGSGSDADETVSEEDEDEDEEDE